MLSNFKGKPEPAPAVPPPAPAKPAVAAAPPPPRPAQPTPSPGAPARPETICSMGAGTSIVGNITCDGPAQFYGHIEGEVRGTELLIGEGADIVGNVIAQESRSAAASRERSGRFG